MQTGTHEQRVESLSSATTLLSTPFTGLPSATDYGRCFATYPLVPPPQAWVWVFCPRDNMPSPSFPATVPFFSLAEHLRFHGYMPSSPCLYPSTNPLARLLCSIVKACVDPAHVPHHRLLCLGVLLGHSETYMRFLSWIDKNILLAGGFAVSSHAPYVPLAYPLSAVFKQSRNIRQW